MSNLSAAQSAQQNNRTADGRYAEKSGADPGDVGLDQSLAGQPFVAEVALEWWDGRDYLEYRQVSFDLGAMLRMADAETREKLTRQFPDTDWLFHDAVDRGLVEPWDGPFTVSYDPADMGDWFEENPTEETRPFGDQTIAELAGLAGVKRPSPGSDGARFLVRARDAACEILGQGDSPASARTVAVEKVLAEFEEERFSVFHDLGLEGDEHAEADERTMNVTQIVRDRIRRTANQVVLSAQADPHRGSARSRGETPALDREGQTSAARIQYVTNLSAAQAAQQHNRTGDGRYAEKAGSDPGDLALVTPPSAHERMLDAAIAGGQVDEEIIDAFDGYQGIDFNWEVEQMTEVLAEQHRYSRDPAPNFSFAANRDGEISGYNMTVGFGEGTERINLTMFGEMKHATTNRSATGREAAVAILEMLDGDYQHLMNQGRRLGLASDRIDLDRYTEFEHEPVRIGPVPRFSDRFSAEIVKSRYSDKPSVKIYDEVGHQQLVSTYYVETLRIHDGGISLHGGVPEWTLTSSEVEALNRHLAKAAPTFDGLAHKLNLLPTDDRRAIEKDLSQRTPDGLFLAEAIRVHGAEQGSLSTIRVNGHSYPVCEDTYDALKEHRYSL